MAPASFNEDTKNEALHVENAFYDRGYIPDTPEEKRLVRKVSSSREERRSKGTRLQQLTLSLPLPFQIDIRMLPMLWVMYSE